jgi:putative DNA primase/helicase
MSSSLNAVCASDIARALGGQKTGGEWVARCPAHDDRTPSLSIREKGGKVLVHCHTGCKQAEVIAALEKQGLWSKQAEAPDADAVKRSEYALTLWRQSRPTAGTVVETYLASRGLRLPAGDALRFHPSLKHPSGSRWPAMVALVTRRDGEPAGIHRTFVLQDGSGKAPVTPAKMMLGTCAGGAVRLAKPAETLAVGEGIESTLSAMQATGAPSWAALSTSGLKALALPDAVREVVILADGDTAGESAARVAARRWHREGRRVRIARPPRGNDFNDMLVRRNASAKEIA